jgi:RNA polymerase sigma factor (sigma-70 family)
MGLHGRSPLLRLQSDERLVSLVRRGNMAAFEMLVSRYQSRLLAFCRHLLGSREDAEDVLQEVLSAAFNAMLADERPINVRPWLYRIARNRSLNHLRRIQAVGVDSMDVHFSDHGASTADKVHGREEFRLLLGDIQELPETQRTALVLREMDALSYEQIAEAMETTVPSVKSLLVRARVSLAEAAEARMLSCEEVRFELGEAAEGLRRRPGPLVRRHLKTCERCATFRDQLKQTNKSLAALLPVGGFALLKKFAILHAGHSASAGSSSAGTAGPAAAAGTAAAGTAAVGSGAGFVSAGIGAIASKAAAGLAAAALVTAGAVEGVPQPGAAHRSRSLSGGSSAPIEPSRAVAPVYFAPAPRLVVRSVKPSHPKPPPPKPAPAKPVRTAAAPPKPPLKPKHPLAKGHHKDATVPPGRDATQTDPTVLPPPPAETTTAATPTATDPSSTTTTPTPTTTTTTPTSTDSTPPPPASTTSSTSTAPDPVPTDTGDPAATGSAH